MNNVIIEVLVTKQQQKRPSEMKSIHKRLCTCDVEVMEAFVVKFIDGRELHVAVSREAEAVEVLQV